MGQPRPLFHFFQSFQSNNTILSTHQCEKCHVHTVYDTGNRTYHLLNLSCLPEPLDQGSRLWILLNSSHQNFSDTLAEQLLSPTKCIGFKSQHRGLRAWNNLCPLAIRRPKWRTLILEFWTHARLAADMSRSHSMHWAIQNSWFFTNPWKKQNSSYKLCRQLFIVPDWP